MDFITWLFVFKQIGHNESSANAIYSLMSIEEKDRLRREYEAYSYAMNNFC